MLDGDEIVFGSDDDERKVTNARRHPKGAVVIGGEPETDDSGYMNQADLFIQNDRNEILLRRMAKRYASEHASKEWMSTDTVIIRLKPRRVTRVW